MTAHPSQRQQAFTVDASSTAVVMFDPAATLRQARDQHFALRGYSEAGYRRRGGGVGIGALIAPRATTRAFLLGRRSRNLYGQDLATMLERTVGSVRAETGLDDPPGRATWTDFVLATSCVAAGLALVAFPVAVAAIGLILLVR